MKLYTYDDYLKWRKYFLFNSPCMLKEDSSTYTVLYNDLNETKINDIHDKSYRNLLNDKEEFSLFLSNFLGYTISSDNLSKYNNDFITNNFNNRRSDIVYKLNNKPIYIFVEHQSTIDYSINYRIFSYYSLLLNDVVDKTKIKQKNYKFPIIIPILLYTGTNKWNLAPNIKDKQVNSKVFNNKKLDYEYDFISIHNYSIPQLLKSNTTIGYMMATDKCISKDELYDVLNTLSLLDISDSQKKILQRYIFFVFGKSFSKKIRDELIKKFNKGVVENMKCAWQYLIEDIRRDRDEGRAEGLAEGKAQGIKKGQKEEKIKIIKKMLQNGESIDKIKLYCGYSLKEIRAIQKELNLLA